MKRSKELATAARHLFHIKRRGQRSKLARGHTTTSKHILSCSFPRRLSSEWSDRSSMVLRSRSRLRRSSRSLANGSSCSPHPSAAHKRSLYFFLAGFGNYLGYFHSSSLCFPRCTAYNILLHTIPCMPTTLHDPLHHLHRCDDDDDRDKAASSSSTCNPHHNDTLHSYPYRSIHTTCILLSSPRILISSSSCQRPQNVTYANRTCYHPGPLWTSTSCNTNPSTLVLLSVCLSSVRRTLLSLSSLYFGVTFT